LPQLEVRHEVWFDDGIIGAFDEEIRPESADFVVDAVTLLDNVLVRMEGHQFKKRAELRALKSWPIED
jgi:pyruvate kinase